MARAKIARALVDLQLHPLDICVNIHILGLIFNMVLVKVYKRYKRNTFSFDKVFFSKTVIKQN